MNLSAREKVFKVLTRKEGKEEKDRDLTDFATQRPNDRSMPRVRIYQPTTDGRFACPKCDCTFASPQSASRHVKTHDNNAKKVTKIDDIVDKFENHHFVVQTDEGLRFRCPCCVKLFKQVGRLLHHANDCRRFAAHPDRIKFVDIVNRYKKVQKSVAANKPKPTKEADTIKSPEPHEVPMPVMLLAKFNVEIEPPIEEMPSPTPIILESNDLIDCCRTLFHGGLLRAYELKTDTHIELQGDLDGLKDKFEDVYIEMCDEWFDFTRSDDFNESDAQLFDDDMPFETVWYIIYNKMND